MKKSLVLSRPSSAGLCVASLLLSALSADSQERKSAADVPREILCLYDSRDLHDGSFRNNYAWQYAQVVLDHLGWVCRYHDLRKALPPDADLKNTRAILLWAHDPYVPRPDDLCRWLARHAKEGRRLLLLLEGVLMDDESRRPGSTEPFNEMLASIGVTFAGEFPGLTSAFDAVVKDPDMAEFERKLDPALPVAAHFKATARGNRVHLRVRRKDRPDADIDLIVTGPRGGLAYAPFALYADHRIGQFQWRLNPFRFFEEATGAAGLPRPDITTLWGRRIYFSHVDGDGADNRVLDPGSSETCAQVFQREFLERYGLPVTVSMIAHDVEKSGDAAQTARKIFALDNVEPAVHAYAHPLDWTRGTLSYDVQAYRFDVEKETRGAVEIVRQRSVPEGRRLAVFLWSGDRNPGERALEILDGLGVENLNIEDVFFDTAHPSYAFVKPAYMPVGSRMQFNARASSENLYTRLWTRHLWAFRQVIETFKRTGAPVRICPINLYHHFYVVERKTPREVLHEIHAWILQQSIHGITAGEYVQVLKGFLNARIRRAGDGSWFVSDYGACRTVRFDAERRHVDLAASEGVAGYAHDQGCLYVHLTGRPARIVLTATVPARPYVRDASGEAQLTPVEDGFELSIQSRGPVAWTVGGVPAGSTWGVAWGERRQDLHASDARSIAVSLPEKGRMKFSLRPKR